MKRFFAAATLLLAGPASAGTLSPVAQKIYDKLKARPDIATECQDKDQLGNAVRSTVRSMVISGEVSGRPRDEARQAAIAIRAECPSLKPGH